MEILFQVCNIERFTLLDAKTRRRLIGVYHLLLLTRTSGITKDFFHDAKYIKKLFLADGPDLEVRNQDGLFDNDHISVLQGQVVLKLSGIKDFLNVKFNLLLHAFNVPADLDL